MTIRTRSIIAITPSRPTGRDTPSAVSVPAITPLPVATHRTVRNRLPARYVSPELVSAAEMLNALVLKRRIPVHFQIENYPHGPLLLVFDRQNAAIIRQLPAAEAPVIAARMSQMSPEEPVIGLLLDDDA